MQMIMEGSLLCKWDLNVHYYIHVYANETGWFIIMQMILEGSLFWIKKEFTDWNENGNQVKIFINWQNAI